uniref:Heat shock protein 70 n=1 Tax=Corethron hystrix TaxID=216773 RepID=A0A7S1FWH8_9STRA|mmetsp:Transcript_36238/g.84748  ORF Transcript_36238/g.84748 Transcript_36238/m.84748 type:complete len:624 (+) Transcript_36238:248-2119(+)
MSSKIIGIDLGTTYSCVSCWDEKNQRVEVIPTPSGDRTMPSWVAFTPSGKLVGMPAKSQSASNPRNTVYDVKRIIGRSFHDPVVQKEINVLPFTIVNGGQDKPKVEVAWREGKKELSPEEISSMVLTELKRAAEVHLGEEVKSAVITVPAHFNNQQRQATKDAGRIAGLDVRRIINEPTAAALAYGLHDSGSVKPDNKEDKKSNVVIFDLGGGTFDVSILSMDGGVFEVRATGGDTHLGGEDFDSTIAEWCIEKIASQHGEKIAATIKKSARANARLRRAVENAKKALSSSNTVSIEVDSISGDIDFAADLSRTEFESLNSELFGRCIDTVLSVVEDAEITVDDVTDVVLVGGSTRVPYLQQRLHALFGGRIELCKTIHPDEAVAIGAAVQGRILASGGSGGGKDLAASETTTDLLLLDVTPLSLGIELEGRAMSTLIKRNTAIPCRKTRTYTTVEDWQTEIDVVVYEGERPCVDANNRLGSFVISGIQKARSGEPKVDVSFALDANGILNVSARDQVTGAEARAEIKAESGRLTESEIEKMIADAERYREEDAELTAKVAYRTALEEALFTAQSSVAKGTGQETELCDLMDWLELDSEAASLEEMKSRGRIIEDKFGIIVSQ